MKYSALNNLQRISLILLVFVLNGCATAYYSGYPEYQKIANQKITQLHQVAILSSNTNLFQQSLSGKIKSLTDTHRSVSKKMIATVKSVVTKLGYNPIVVETTPPRYITAIQSGLQKLPELFVNSDAGFIRHNSRLPSIGPQLAPLAGSLNVDAFLVVLYTSIQPTFPRSVAGFFFSLPLATIVALADPITASYLLAFPFTRDSQLEMALIDGKTGDILWRDSSEFRFRSLDSAFNSVIKTLPDSNGYHPVVWQTQEFDET